MNLTIGSIIAEAVIPNAVASGLMVSTCSISMPIGTFDSGGAPTTSGGVPAYIAVAGLQNIQCISAQPAGKVAATEQKTESEILGFQWRHVLLAGYFPAIPQGDQNWQATIQTFNTSGVLVDTTVWDLIGSEADSQVNMTRLELRIAKI